MRAPAAAGVRATCTVHDCPTPTTWPGTQVVPPATTANSPFDDVTAVGVMATVPSLVNVIALARGGADADVAEAGGTGGEARPEGVHLDVAARTPGGRAGLRQEDHLAPAVGHHRGAEPTGRDGSPPC